VIQKPLLGYRRVSEYPTPLFLELFHPPSPITLQPLHGSAFFHRFGISVLQLQETKGHFLKFVWWSPETRKIFLIFSFLMGSILFQTLVGIWKSKPIYIANALHLFFDNLPILIFLSTSIILQIKMPKRFTFGFLSSLPNLWSPPLLKLL